MNEFEIFVDSSANIPDKMRVERGIHVIPDLLTLDGEEICSVQEGRDYSEIAREFYAKMRQGAEYKTSLVSEARFIEAVSPSLEEGKDVLILTIASGISGTFNQAKAAKATLEQQYPERKVYVLDSANASMGQGLLALKAADLRDMGQSAKACAEWVENNAYKLNSFLTVDDLRYMRRSGRISAFTALAGSLLSIKPVLTADGGTNAKIVSYSKVHGRKKALSALVEAFDKYAVRPETQTIAITHADCEEEANALAKTLKEHGAQDVIVEFYDMCSGSHIGPGTIALFFVGKDRRGDAALPTLQPVGKAVTDKI